MRVRGLAVLLALTGIGVGATSCLDEGSEPGHIRCECAPPPLCGTECKSSCGCCNAAGTWCSTEGIMKASANGSCYDLTRCSGPGRCVVSAFGAVCAESGNNCRDVRAAYESLLPSDPMTLVRSGDGPLPAGAYPSSCPEGCKVSDGHCAQGLGTCWFLSYGPDPELDRLAALYQELGCPPVAPCECPPAPVASCHYTTNGTAGSAQGPLGCFIE